MGLSGPPVPSFRLSRDGTEKWRVLLAEVPRLLVGTAFRRAAQLELRWRARIECYEKPQAGQSGLTVQELPQGSGCSSGRGR